MLFTRPVRIVLTPDEVQLITKTIEGDGGHQLLLREIQNDLEPDGSMTLDDGTLQRVHRYIEAYGGGGFQDRLKAIRSAAWRAGWVQP